MNLLMKVAACLGVSPVENFGFIDPENSARISLPWPTGKAARLEIPLIVMPYRALTKSHTIYRERGMDCRYDIGNICSMFERKKRFPNLKEPLLIPVKRNLFILFDDISKKEHEFLEQAIVIGLKSYMCQLVFYDMINNHKLCIVYCY